MKTQNIKLYIPYDLSYDKLLEAIKPCPAKRAPLSGYRKLRVHRACLFPFS